MTPQELRETGVALFGVRWRAPLARALGVHSRTVKRWEDGTNPIPGLADTAIGLLSDMCIAHRGVSKAAEAMLRAHPTRRRVKF